MAEFQKPLLTFALGAYNQERFIREAVESAFAQTYSPLEIVLSDDCSKDRTFEIMREMAAVYRGPHKIVLNQNPVRKSIGGHINRVVEISHGELLLSAAGDDISLPDRAALVYQAWEEAERRPVSIHSDVIQIDENGATIERRYDATESKDELPVSHQFVKPLDYLENFRPLVFGAAHAYSRRLFEAFGGLPEEVLHEDTAIPFRALLLSGRFVYLKQPLVKYRLHGNNIFLTPKHARTDLKSLQKEEDHLRHDCKHRRIAYDSFLADLESAKRQGLIAPADYEKTHSRASVLRRHYALMSEFLDSGVHAKCRIFSRLSRDGLDAHNRGILARRLVPQSILLRLRLAWRLASLPFHGARS
jgi:glycosyltransferase involved in cell wall biosynthesis